MPDRLTKEARSRLMSRVKNRNTAPEMIVRRALHKMGYRFRLHRKDLAGCPDITLPRYKKVVFVHGCFWHGHSCPRGKRPSSNEEFWNEKIDRNIKRDADAVAELTAEGWGVLILWDCQVKNPNALAEILSEFLGSPAISLT